jgi:rSAM/selenodomain-associated transferase 1
VKTRLVPLLGEARAADLHRRLVLHTLDVARSATDRVRLYCAPDTQHPFFAQCAAQHAVPLDRQCRGDLGVRMLHACIEHLRIDSRVIIVGTDSPALGADHLERAAAALGEGAHIVLAPADDGGYALIGLRRCAPELFQDIPWGTDQVMNVTRVRLERLAWRWVELDTVWDVDRPADYERLEREGWLDALPR